MVIHVCDESKNCKLLLLLMVSFSAGYIFCLFSQFHILQLAEMKGLYLPSLSYGCKRGPWERRLEYFPAPLP